MITQIVAVDNKGMIARSDFNGIIWKCRSDMQRFKSETIGSNIIMGRVTFESIGKPLPGRNNIVLTRNCNWESPNGVTVVNSKDEALKACDSDKGVFVIGGAEVYSLFEDITTDIHLTEILMNAKGDVPYPVDLSKFESYQQEFFDKGDKDDASQLVRRYSLK